MRLATTRFGEISYSEKDIISFKEGLLGLEDHTRYLILRPPESYPFAWLQSLEDSHTAIPVIPAQIFQPSYHFELSDEIAKELSIQKKDKVESYCQVYLAEQSKSSNVNLLMPIVVNLANRQAKQIVLEKKPYTSKHNLFDLLASQKGQSKGSRD